MGAPELYTAEFYGTADPEELLAAVEQIAMEGVKNRASSKFTMIVPEMDVANPIQIIPCTREAVECINLVNVWKRT